MARFTHPQVLFLSWESPWPPDCGGKLRTSGLLTEINRYFETRLVVMSRRELSGGQMELLRRRSASVTRVPAGDACARGVFRIVARMLRQRVPYHCAVIQDAFHRAPHQLRRIASFSGVVYASYGHWGTLIAGQKASNWILDQQNADVHFWRVYASQASSYLLRLAALLNWRLAASHFPEVYSSVGRIVSVCEEDKQLTLDLAPGATVNVIRNGVDCSYYVPNRTPQNGGARLLFTGTSAPRNVTALRHFVKHVFPLIKREVSDAVLLVAGSFSDEAQAEFRSYKSVSFTGRVDDIRPYFDRSHVFVAPFQEAHGSKLKIAEAMAMGMPIVSTPEGARGFPVSHDQTVLLASDNEAFARLVVKLLRSPSRAQALGSAAREFAESMLDWEVLGQQVRAAILAQHDAVVGAEGPTTTAGEVGRRLEDPR